LLVLEKGFDAIEFGAYRVQQLLGRRRVALVGQELDLAQERDDDVHAASGAGPGATVRDAGGFVGALFAIPVAACLQILLSDYAHHPNR